MYAAAAALQLIASACKLDLALSHWQGVTSEKAPGLKFAVEERRPLNLKIGGPLKQASCQRRGQRQRHRDIAVQTCCLERRSDLRLAPPGSDGLLLHFDYSSVDTRCFKARSCSALPPEGSARSPLRTPASLEVACAGAWRCPSRLPNLQNQNQNSSSESESHAGSRKLEPTLASSASRSQLPLSLPAKSPGHLLSGCRHPVGSTFRAAGNRA
jgi:hypothetical protein